MYLFRKPPRANREEKNTSTALLDHINGGGRKQRREMGGSLKIYKWLIANNFPEGFRLLCMNYNFALGRCGYCPHKGKDVIANGG